MGIPELHLDDRVIVVLGFNHKEEETEAFIRKTYPNAKIEIYRWDAKIDLAKIVEDFLKTPNLFGSKFMNLALKLSVAGTQTYLSWWKARANSDKEVEKLAKRLLSEPEELRSRTVLIGHSLGGRIVVKTLAKLAEHGKKINRAIVMGAAIDVKNSEEQIKRAPAGTQNGVENRINADDHVLKFYKVGGIRKSAVRALGIFGASDLKIKHWKDIKIVDKRLRNHYFDCYWRIGKNEKATGNFSTDISDRRSRGI